MSNVRITHSGSGTILAEGPVGWGITPFEGNFYIRRKYLKTNQIRANFLPGSDEPPTHGFAVRCSAN